APLLGSFLAWLTQKNSLSSPPTAPVLAEASNVLARVVHAQWRQEAAARALLDPVVPLAVHWRPGAAELPDDPDNDRTSILGNSAEPDKLAASFGGLRYRRM